MYFYIVNYIMKKIVAFLLIVSLNAHSQVEKTVFDVARTGNLKEIKQIFKTNPKAILEISSEGFSPLILAIYRKNNEVAKFLINKGADVNGNSKMGTPLMAAVVKGNTEMAKLLLSKKVDVNCVDFNGTTALIYATMFKHYDIVDELVKAGANVEMKDNRKNGAIEYAILANDDKLMELLKQKIK